MVVSVGSHLTENTALVQSLFNGTADKVEQFARAGRLLDIAVMGVEYKIRRPLLLEYIQWMADRSWIVIKAAGTITQVEAVCCCVTDPAQAILEHLGGRRARDCIRDISAEREAREQGAHATRSTIWAWLSTNTPGRF